MQATWHSLYLPVADAAAVAAALGRALTALGYRLYDPFPSGADVGQPPWRQRVRHFVAPPAEGWVRVLGQPQAAALPSLSAALGTPLLHAWLDGDEAGLAVWSAAGRDDAPEALVPWLRAGRVAADVARALAAAPPEEGAQAPGPGALPLPEELAALEQRVDRAQAARLSERLARALFGKLGDQGGEQRAQAQALLGGGSPWQTAAGRRLQAAMACLAVPQGWQRPAFEDVQAAYQAARARQHNPHGLRLPGDDEALARLPQVLAYRPVYAGRR